MDNVGNTAILKFENLTIRTMEHKSWWRNKVLKQSVTLLRNGEIRAGDFVAVIGPSGAGKTTFLISLAGKCTLPSEGYVLYNNTDIKHISQGTVEIVPQFEIFVESLSMEIKLGGIKSMKISAMNNLLTVLKLKRHFNTTIKHLSGGEKKLLSLATSLISNPKVIICDEPTTGLDSYNAALVVDVLKNLSNPSNIIICSIHQPSSDLFNEFKSIILLADGQLLLHGTQSLCKDIFESIQLTCPKNYNPAEFYVKAISHSKSKEKYLEKIKDAYKNFTQYQLEFHNEIEETSSQNTSYTVCKRRWLMQVWLLIWRSSLTIKRNKLRHAFELLTGVVITAFIIGFVYGGVSGTTQQGVQDVRGLLWLLISEVSFSIGYTSLIAFEFDLNLFKREAGMYSCSAYYVSRFFCLIPKCIIWPISHIIIGTSFVSIPNTLTTGSCWALILIATGIASASYGLSVGALFTSLHITTEVMPFFDCILILMSGAFMRISSIPLWLHGFKYISHFYYGMDAISNIYWRQITNIDCNRNSTVCVHDGMAVLSESGYSSNNTFLLIDLLGLILITIGWCCLGYVGLWLEKKKGFAY